jgi:hypothetical protein
MHDDVGAAQDADRPAGIIDHWGGAEAPVREKRGRLSYGRVLAD